MLPISVLGNCETTALRGRAEHPAGTAGGAGRDGHGETNLNIWYQRDTLAGRARQINEIITPAAAAGGTAGLMGPRGQLATAAPPNVLRSLEPHRTPQDRAEPELDLLIGPAGSEGGNFRSQQRNRPSGATPDRDSNCENGERPDRLTGGWSRKGHRMHRQPRNGTEVGRVCWFVFIKIL